MHVSVSTSVPFVTGAAMTMPDLPTIEDSDDELAGQGGTSYQHGGGDMGIDGLPPQRAPAGLVSDPAALRLQQESAQFWSGLAQSNNQNPYQTTNLQGGAPSRL